LLLFYAIDCYKLLKSNFSRKFSKLLIFKGYQRKNRGTPGVTAFELIKRAYESNTLEKLRDFLSIEPQLATG
jgi:hypothetical protein